MSIDEPIDFDTFVHWATSEINTSFDLLDEPDQDVAPLAVIAEAGDLFLVTWEVDEELRDNFLTHVLPPTLAARTPHIAGLGITSYLTSPTGEREETELLCVLETDGQRSREATLAAQIERSADAPPVLGEWGLAAGELAPAFARPMYMGMLGQLEG